MIAVLLGAVLFCALVLALAGKRLRFSLPGLAFALLLFAAAVALAALGVKSGLVFCRYTSEPEETVETFFDEIRAGRYENAYALLGNYSDLGLAGEPEDAVSAELYDALRASYACRLSGEAETDGLSAVQKVEFTALDLSALQTEIRAGVLAHLAEIVDSRPYDEVYDAQDRYRTEVTEEAYRLTVSDLLSHSADYVRTETLSVALSYDTAGWHIVADRALLNALSGYTIH